MRKLILDRRKLELDYAADCLFVKALDSTPRSVPLSQLSQVICLHSVQLSTSLIGQLMARDIDLIVVNQRYETHGFSLFSNQSKQVERRCKQYQWQQNEPLRLLIAKPLCIHKLMVMSRVASDSNFGAEAYVSLDKSIVQARMCEQENQLRGIEGAAQKQFFACWRSLLPDHLGFNKRIRRPPPDPVNAILSLTYMLVYHEAVRHCMRAGLDPQLGFYHRVTFGRQSLACDLMEPVRPNVERWVVELFRNQLLDKRMFSTSSSGCLLGKLGRTHYYGYYEKVRSHWSLQLRASAHWLRRTIDLSSP